LLVLTVCSHRVALLVRLSTGRLLGAPRRVNEAKTPAKARCSVQCCPVHAGNRPSHRHHVGGYGGPDQLHPYHPSSASNNQAALYENPACQFGLPKRRQPRHCPHRNPSTLVCRVHWSMASLSQSQSDPDPRSAWSTSPHSALQYLLPTVSGGLWMQPEKHGRCRSRGLGDDPVISSW
jgi:hypothetical protein